MTSFKLDISLNHDISKKEIDEVARDMAEKMFASFPQHDILVVGYNGGETEFALLNPDHLPQIHALKEEPECIVA